MANKKLHVKDTRKEPITN